MKNYEILPHTADLKIRVLGKTKKELFSNAFLAMEECLKADVKQGTAERDIKMKALDLPALLVDFLNEILYLNQAEKEIYNKVKFFKFTDPLIGTSAEQFNQESSGQAEIEAKIFGKKVERFGEDIKAATHHNSAIRQKEDGFWEATILFDI